MLEIESTLEGTISAIITARAVMTINGTHDRTKAPKLDGRIAIIKGLIKKATANHDR